MKLGIKTSLAGGLLLTSLITNCSKKSDSDSDSDATDEEKSEEAAKDAVAEAESVADLNLSGSLNITLPSALDSASGTSLRLVAGKKSSEACMIGQTVRDVTENLASAAGFFCHLEVEADKIKFGTKYSIETNGEEFGRVWADNSNAAEGQITLYMCEAVNGVMKLKEKIDITGVTKNGAKGTMQQMHHEGAHTGKSSIVFDANVTEEGTFTLTAEQAYEDSENDGSFKRAVTLNFVEDGVSELVFASNGTWNGNAFEEKAVGKFNGEVGTTLFSNSGTYAEQTFTWTHASFFDTDGYVVDPTMYDVFAEDGELYIAESELPDFLDADFSPDEPEGWDCEFDEVVELEDVESAEHEACNTHHSEFADCWNEAEFEQGEAAE
jgi:hypothetical protein